MRIISIICSFAGSNITSCFESAVAVTYLRCLRENALRSLLSTCVTTCRVATWAVLPRCEVLKNNSTNDVKTGGSQTTLRKPSATRIFFYGSTDIVSNNKCYVYIMLEVGLIVQDSATS